MVHTLTEYIERMTFPPGYKPQQITDTSEGIEVAALEYWFLLDKEGHTALLPRGVTLCIAPDETLEQFLVRAARISEQLLSPDE